MTSNIIHPSANHPNLVVGFTTRHDGDMSRTNLNRLEVMPARRRAFAIGGLNYGEVALIAPSHCPNIEVYERGSSRVHRFVFRGQQLITADFDRYVDGADGLLTYDRSIPVALVSGDCLPLLVWDERSDLHGIVHIGLMGALNHMVATLAEVLNDVGARAPRFYIGPTIGAEHYNLSTSGLWSVIVDQVSGPSSDVYDHVARRDGHLYLDLVGYVCEQILKAGYPSSDVLVHPAITGIDNDSYFSHHLSRGSGSTPRFMSFIGFS